MRIRSETGLPVKKKTSVLCAFCFEDTNVPIGMEKFNKVSIQESCDIGCKDSLAVFFRSASLITHSRKIRISNL